MNRKLLPLASLSIALVLALGACSQDAPVAQAAEPAPAAAADTAPAAAPADAPAVTVASGTYQIDPSHTMVLAQWNHMGFSNPTANFDDASGSIVWNAEDPTQSSVEVVLPLTSIRSFSDDFDKHLASADFFDTAKFPEARFKSTSVTPAEGNHYTVVGDLTLKGVTKPVTLDVTVNGAGEHPMMKQQAVGFDATGTIKRSDFGVDKYTPGVSDDVKLRITTEAMVAKAE
jgi:polyisoprenoid-binding protein YceI